MLPKTKAMVLATSNWLYANAFNLNKELVNSLPNDKILTWSKLKAFGDDKQKKIDVAEMKISHLDRSENNVGKEGDAGYQHFFLFPQCFPKPFSRLGTID